MDDRDRAAESYPEIAPAQRASAHLLALRRFWWMVVGAAALTASLAYVSSSSQVKLYDASAKVLSSLKQLRKLNLYHTFFKEEGYRHIREALPECEIIFDPKSSDPKRRRS